MKKQRVLSLSCIAVATLLSACGNSQYEIPTGPTPMGYGAPQQATSAYVNPYAEQAQAPVSTMQMAPSATPYQAVDNSASLAEINALRERLNRAERAMLRLDKRMQLLERNELSRISGMEMSGTGTESPSGMFQPMSYSESNSFESGSAAPLGVNSFQPVEPNAMLQNGHSGYSDVNAYRGASLQPVGYTTSNNAMITSSLQAAPAQRVATASTTQALTPRLPSLADSDESMSDDASIAVWSIEYQTGKIWPEKAQLAESKDVIEAIRNGETFTVYARGDKPNSREFRDRVRAVSKYLSKVSNVEAVPIASMPAEHLGSDVVEIMVVR